MLSLFKRYPGSGGQIGVFVTADGVAAAQVSAGAGRKPRLECCVYEPRGEQDPLGRVAERLAGRRNATVSVLDPSAYRLLLVEAPDVPPEELRAAVRWRIKDLIDFHVDDAVIDVFEMPGHARGGARRMMYAVTALLAEGDACFLGAGVGRDAYTTERSISSRTRASSST